METNDWTQRVDRITSTTHEQLRTLVGDAHEVLGRVSDWTREQGSVSVDSRRELDEALERTMSDTADRLIDSIKEIRADFAAGIEAVGEQLDAETDRLQAVLTRYTSELESRFEMIDRSIGRLRSKVEEMSGLWAKQDEILRTRMTAVEDRSAARMIEMLAEAFAGLSVRVSGSNAA